MYLWAILILYMTDKIILFPIFSMSVGNRIISIVIVTNVDNQDYNRTNDIKEIQCLFKGVCVYVLIRTVVSDYQREKYKESNILK